jgi:hypothetical protein
MKKIKLLQFLIIFWVPATILGQVLRVPDDYSTIQLAINATQSGDTVQVSDGVYLENIVFPEYPIVVASHFLINNDPDHIESTVIDGSNPINPDRATVVDMTLATDTLSVICGFTIKGGAGTLDDDDELQSVRIGGGVFISAGKVIHNIIRNNEIEGSNLLLGAGIASSHAYKVPNRSGNLIIRNNKIYENKLIASSVGEGAGINLIPCNGQVLLEGNEIYDNSVTNTGPYKAIGGGIAVLKNTSSQGRVIIRNNRVYKNSLHCNVTAGAGIYIVPWFDSIPDIHHPIEIYNNLIYENYSQEMGGGIGVWYVGAFRYLAPVDPVIYNNTIVNNEARIGAGISNIDAEIVLFNNIIWNEKENYTDGEIRNQLTNYCPHWCRSSFKGIVHLSNNSLSDPEPYESCNNCFPYLDGSFCLCSGNYNVGHGIPEMTVKGVTYTAPKQDFNNNPRPNPIDEFVDIGAIESAYEIGFDCTTNTGVPIHPTDGLEITIYPNPFEDYLFIGNLPSTDEGLQLRVTDLLGRIVLNEQIVASEAEQGVCKIPTSGLRMGVYMCSIYHYNHFVKSFLLVNKNR